MRTLRRLMVGEGRDPTGTQGQGQPRRRGAGSAGSLALRSPSRSRMPWTIASERSVVPSLPRRTAWYSVGGTTSCGKRRRRVVAGSDPRKGGVPAGG